MKNRLAMAVLAGALATLSTAAPPDKKIPLTDNEAVYKKLDENEDGKLSPTEFKALGDLLPKPTGKKAKDAVPPDLAKAFKLLDRNGDGSLSLEEYKGVGKLVALTPMKK